MAQIKTKEPITLNINSEQLMRVLTTGAITYASNMSIDSEGERPFINLDQFVSQDAVMFHKNDEKDESIRVDCLEELEIDTRDLYYIVRARFSGCDYLFEFAPRTKSYVELEKCADEAIELAHKLGILMGVFFGSPYTSHEV